MKATFIAIRVGVLFALGLTLFACAELNPNTEGQLKSALEAKNDAFRTCYEAALTRDRETKGTMGLILQIHAQNGNVTSSSIGESSIPDNTMKSCVADAASDITLPEPPGVSVEGHYDIAFNFEQ